MIHFNHIGQNVTGQLIFYEFLFLRLSWSLLCKQCKETQVTDIGPSQLRTILLNVEDACARASSANSFTHHEIPEKASASDVTILRNFGLSPQHSLHYQLMCKCLRIFQLSLLREPKQIFTGLYRGIYPYSHTRSSSEHLAALRCSRCLSR